MKKKLENDNFFFPFCGSCRAHEMPGLASMHTLFVREHNKYERRIYQMFLL